MGNLQVRFLEGWAPAMAPGYSTIFFVRRARDKVFTPLASKRIVPNSDGLGVVMPSRKSLHDLIDTLPEAALESAQRVLQNYQTWPPKPLIDVERMRERVEERFRR